MFITSETKPNHIRKEYIGHKDSILNKIKCCTSFETNVQKWDNAQNQQEKNSFQQEKKSQFLSSTKKSNKTNLQF